MKKYIYLIICLLFAAINFNLFLKPLSLVTGGTQGLAIIIKNFLKFKPSIIVLIINIVSLLMSFILLKKQTTTSAILSTFIYPLFIRLTNFIPTLSIVKNNIIISSIIAGIICGTTGGIIYKLSFSSGGLTIINILINKYFNIKISTSNFIINSLIIIVGSFIFGIKKLIYSLIVVITSSTLINIILKKIDKKRIIVL